MPESSEGRLASIDNLLQEFEQSSGIVDAFADIDALCDEVDNGFEARKNEISQWPEERKRKEAADSQDPFVLNLLTLDENFNVRALAACNASTPDNSVRRLVESANDYLKMVIANKPNCPVDVLDRICELTDEPEVLDAVKLHPNVSPITMYKIIGKRPTSQPENTEQSVRQTPQDMYVSP